MAGGGKESGLHWGNLFLLTFIAVRLYSIVASLYF